MSKPVPQSSLQSMLCERARRIRWRLALGVALALAAVASVLQSFWDIGGYDHRTLRDLLDGLVYAYDLFRAEAWPLDWSRADKYPGLLLDTLVMGTAGTAIAVVLSLFTGVLAAPNTCPYRIVRYPVRFFLNFTRSIPEYVFGILFVASVGIGLLPGMLALAVHSLGMTGKFFAEIIEHTDEGPVEAARATGASQAHVITFGVLPQVLPRLADVAVYRWEYNFRASLVLGAIGAGGIGRELITAMSLMEYRKAGSVLVVILVATTILDAFSSWLRRRLS